MGTWRNESGRPLSSIAWLEAHHKAKLPERTAFANAILRRRPKKIVDLGCASGLWLSVFNDLAPKDCELVGIDSDVAALELASARAEAWTRKTSFEQADMELSSTEIPDADVFLAFNLFPYLRDPARLLALLKERLHEGGVVAVRQYDGSLFRVGPMAQATRSLIDHALEGALLESQQFRHYDLDRVFVALASSTFTNQEIDFELFRRVSPYSSELLDYLKNSIDWVNDYISDDARAALQSWYESCVKPPSPERSYFVEVDLVAWLS